MALLEARDVCKYYRAGARDEVRALDGVSLAVEQGQCVLLQGPSGSGKSTLLALLGALDRPTRGQVFFDQRDLTSCSDVELARTRRRIGFVFQNFSLIAGLPVWENVTYPLIPRGMNRRQRTQTAGKVLADLGLADKFHARPEELSGGEQQRVALARALAGNPTVLMADEPTSNLDQDSALSIRALLHELNRRGTTLVLSSHDAHMAPLATVMHTLESGRLRAHDAPSAGSP